MNRQHNTFFLVCSQSKSILIRGSLLSVSLFINTASADGLSSEVTVPEIAAYYQTTVMSDDAIHRQKQNSHWYLWRQNNKIEILSANKKVGELWQKRKHNQVALTYLYHGKQFAIRYTSSDLKALHNAQLWTTKQHFVSPILLEQLQKTGTKTVLGYTATMYSGVVKGYQLDIDWISDIQAPGRIRQHHEDKTVEVTLMAVYPFDKAPWQPINSDSYDDMDYADIGDNESHPVVGLHLKGMGLETHQHRH